jgi:ABC-type methionine transport system permease subunit
MSKTRAKSQQAGITTDTVQEQKRSFDWGTLFSILACFCLGAGLFLFIHNNKLLANSARNLWRVESLVMLAVLGIPFILMLLHLVRSFRPSRKT